MGRLRRLDKKILLSEVHSRPPLWNRCDPNFKNTSVTNKLWEEVGEACNLSGYEAKSKWKNAKDTFRRELQKIQHNECGEGSSNCYKSTWPFFELMSFVKDVMFPIDGNSPKREEDSIVNIVIDDIKDYDEVYYEENQLEENDDTEDNRCAEELPFPVPSITLCSSLRNRKRRKTRNSDDFDQKFLYLEEKKLKLMENAEQKIVDADEHFLMSLLPYIQELNPLQKLDLRSKLHTVVLEAYRRKDIPQHSKRFPRNL